MGGACPWIGASNPTKVSWLGEPAHIDLFIVIIVIAVIDPHWQPTTLRRCEVRVVPTRVCLLYSSESADGLDGV